MARVSDGLRVSRPDIQIYAVDAHGSLVTSDTGRPHLLTGIGAARKSDFLRAGAYDRAVQVRDDEAFAFCRMLADDTGLAVGGSSGAVLAAFAHVMADPARQCRCPVAILPDGGQSYRSTLYSDDWLAQRQVLGQVRAAQARARTSGVFFEPDLRLDRRERECHAE